ncbi:hypothetical protein QBC42DRAFT_311684 [Cladorrhinum samala]|uniref:Uncharacterized protein n=1 Tax=Cladorrhinum samala TaxID=585594 RepID=A0AAV9HXF1_9PEZI|nr:hypothetical protein QBC42DRAFT_311684 [Cladorrhinum samala]
MEKTKSLLSNKQTCSSNLKSRAQTKAHRKNKRFTNMLQLSISSRRPAATLAAIRKASASSSGASSRKLTCLTHGFKEIEAWKKRRREADGRNRTRKSASDSPSPVQVPSSPLIRGPDTAIAKSTGRTATPTTSTTPPTTTPGAQTVSQPGRSKITLFMDYSSSSFAPPLMVIRVGPFKLFEERMIGPPGMMSSHSDVVRSTKKPEEQYPQGPAVEDGEEEGPAGAKQQRPGEIAPAAPPLKVEWEEQKTTRGITTGGMNRELPLFLGGGGSF